MKILSIIAALLFTSFAGFSQFTCATSFKVNNGNGTCGAAGELRLTFPGGCPALVPIIDSVYINGVKSDVTFAAPDASKCGGANGYISYCVTSGNMPPANVWNIFFRNALGVYNCTVVSSTTGVLAVKLVSFDALITGSSITCKWTAGSEIDNDHYELERSFDGTTFTTIAYVFSSETSNSYSYPDKSSALQTKNVVFYRLKDVDNMGRVSYSQVISVKLGTPGTQNLQASPNPFRDNISLVVESATAGTGEIRLLNLAGQPVVTKTTTINKGSNNLQVSNLGNLPKGVYVARVSINGVFAGNQKIIKN